MAVPTTFQYAPGSITLDETNLDQTTAADGQIDVTVCLHFNGLTSQVAADWATMLATNFASPSVIMSYDNG